MRHGLLHQAIAGSMMTAVLFLASPIVPPQPVDRRPVEPNPVAAQLPKITPLPQPSASPSASPAPAPASAGLRSAGRPAVLGSSTARGGASGFSYGIASGLASMPAAALGPRLDDMKALGVKWVRYDIEWSNIEYQAPGVYDWGDYDRAVQAVSARGLQTLAVLDYTPAWARLSQCAGTAMCAPADVAAYARFAAVAAAHYKGLGVHAWEIWNEPNSAVFFQPGADVGRYAAMLKAASAAIKSVDPAAVIVSGGTAPGDTGGGWVSPPDFVAGLYAAGAGGSFDVLGHHPYTWPYSPAYPMPGNAWAQLATIHGIMAAHGDGAKPIWITEYGAPTGGPGPLASSGMTTAEAAADHVTEALQAKMVSDAVAIAHSYPWVGALFWYSYLDAGTAADTVENFFGLVRPDGSHKPAYDAMRAAIGAYP